MNNISNRSSVLPILCEHGKLSAIVEWTQSDHSDCRHWMEGVSTTKPEIAERKLTLRNLKNVHFEPDFYSIMIYWQVKD